MTRRRLLASWQRNADRPESRERGMSRSAASRRRKRGQRSLTHPSTTKEREHSVETAVTFLHSTGEIKGSFVL